MSLTEPELVLSKAFVISFVPNIEGKTQGDVNAQGFLDLCIQVCIVGRTSKKWGPSVSPTKWVYTCLTWRLQSNLYKNKQIVYGYFGASR